MKKNVVCKSAVALVLMLAHLANAEVLQSRVKPEQKSTTGSLINDPAPINKIKRS